MGGYGGCYGSMGVMTVSVIFPDGDKTENYYSLL